MIYCYIASRADYISALDLSDKEKADWYCKKVGDEIPMDELMGAVCSATEVAGSEYGQPLQYSRGLSDNFNSYLSWQILEAVDRERFDAKLDAVLNRNIGDSGFSVLFRMQGRDTTVNRSDFANNDRIGALI